MYVFNRKREEINEVDAEIKQLKQRLLKLESRKRNMLFDYYHGTFGGLLRAKVRRRKEQQNV